MLCLSWLAHHLDGTDLSDQFFRDNYAYDRRLVLKRLRYGIYLSLGYLFTGPVKAFYLLALRRFRLKFVRKLDDRFVRSVGKVHHKAGKSRAFRYAETAARAFLIVYRRDVVDVRERLDRSRRAAGRTGVAGDALRTFYYYISALFLLPRLLRGKDGPGPVLYKDSAAE